MDPKVEPSGRINSVSGERHSRCFCCGNEGHFARDKICPVLEATCNRCHIKRSLCGSMQNEAIKIQGSEAKSSRKKSKGGGLEVAMSAKRGKALAVNREVVNRE